MRSIRSIVSGWFFQGFIVPGMLVAIGNVVYAGSAGVVSEDLIEALFNPQQLDSLEQRYGADARLRVESWHSLLDELRGSHDVNDLEKSRAANEFFNRVRWITDREHWGREDYWATPVETLASNGGDCEDFSIGKYFTLGASGVQESRLRITYVQAYGYNQAHMVLAYYASPQAEPLILDNINKTILPASQRPDLRPVYSFNGEGLWLAQLRLQGLENELPQWRRLLERMRE